MNLKIKIYSLFQFFSLASLVFFLIGTFLFLINANQSAKLLDVAFWISEFKMLFSFSVKNTSSLLGSSFIYISLILILSSWATGFSLFLLKNRNYYDTMFLLFVGIPIISNIFCLLAQIYINENKITSSNLNKLDIENEKTKIMKLLSKQGTIDKKDVKAFTNKINKLKNKKSK